MSEIKLIESFEFSQEWRAGKTKEEMKEVLENIIKDTEAVIKKYENKMEIKYQSDK